MERVKVKGGLLTAGLLALLALPALLLQDRAPGAVAAPLFKLPWQAGQRMYVLQGPNQGTHTGYSSRYAYDFAPGPFDGTSFTVRAARGGKVAKIVQHFATSPDCDPAYNGQTNYVLLDHGDGLSTLYLHLAQNSVIPKLGASVNQGDPLALTGHTGYVCGPAHLHFTVVDSKTWQSLDFPFADRDAQRDGGRPRANQWYLSENNPTSYSVRFPHVPRRYTRGPP